MNEYFKKRSENSTVTHIAEFVKSKCDNTLFVINDFEGIASYTCVRSALVRLCESKDLMRICRGVYMKVGAQKPNDIEIAKAIARKTNTKIQYTNIKVEEKKRKIIIYIDGSTRNYKLPNGTTISFRHTDKI